MGTKPAVSLRCAAFMAFIRSQIFPVWTKASWTPHFITPAVLSRLIFLLPSTRTSRSRGSGTRRVPCSVLHLHHLSQTEGTISSAAAEHLHLSHKLLTHNHILSLSPIFLIINTAKKFFQIPRQSVGDQTGVGGSYRPADLCNRSSATRLWKGIQ